MTHISIPRRGHGKPVRVLAIGAHCDDIEIGAGALLRSLASTTDGLRAHFVVMTSTPARAAETRACLGELVGPTPPRVDVHTLRDTRLPMHFDEVKDVLGALADEDFDLVLTHDPGDAHQDHRILGELVPTAFRRNTIAHFEIPKWDGDLGVLRPNAYLPLSLEDVAAKWKLIHKHYMSQHSKDWFTEETVRSLARLRGMECRAPYAEAFRIEKLTINLPERSE
jgi:LmbE family N-acetylglucosaminyl deacetylase